MSPDSQARSLSVIPVIAFLWFVSGWVGLWFFF